jgi:hypothetical protein
MFIDRADIILKLPKEVLNFSQYKEVFDTIRALIGKGDDPDEFLLRLSILQYFEEGHYEQRYHTKRRVAEALGVDEIHLRDAFADLQHHEILVPDSSGSSYRLHDKAAMYIMYLKGFFIERAALSNLKEQFIRLDKLADSIGIQDSSRKLLYRVYFDALDSIREFNEKTQTKAVIKKKDELMDFFLELQPRVREKLVEDFDHYRANIFFLREIAPDGAAALLKSGIEIAKHSDSSSIKRNIDPLVVEDYIKRVPSELILALVRFHNEPVGIPSGNEQEAVNAYLRLFQEISGEFELEELLPARSEEIAFFAGANPPPTPPNIEELALDFYASIQKDLPNSLLSLISAISLEHALLKWHFLAILAKKNMITFESGIIRASKEGPYAFFEDMKVVPLST